MTRKNKWLCYFLFLKLINGAFEQLPGKDILCIWNCTHFSSQYKSLFLDNLFDQFYRTAFCSESAWQAHGAIVSLELGPCSAASLRFLGPPSGLLAAMLSAFLWGKPRLPCSMLRAFEPSSQQSAGAGGDDSLPRRLVVPPRPLSRHFTQCLVSKAEKLTLLSLMSGRAHTCSPSSGRGYPAHLSDREPPSGSW